MRNTMRNFYQDDDDFRLDGYFDMEDEEFDGVSDNNEIIGFAQIDLLANELSQKLLKKAIHLAENSFLWRFRSFDSKLKSIEKIYIRLRELTENADNIEEIEEIETENTEE